MQNSAYPFFIFQLVLASLKGFGYGVIVQKTTFNLGANTLFSVFLQILESFSGGKHYTANSFVTNICGVIFTAPIH